MKECIHCGGEIDWYNGQWYHYEYTESGFMVRKAFCFANENSNAKAEPYRGYAYRTPNNYLKVRRLIFMNRWRHG